jgi:hypothetical protein
MVSDPGSPVWDELRKLIAENVRLEERNALSDPLLFEQFVDQKNRAERAEAEIARLKREWNASIGSVTSLRNLQAGFIDRAERAEAERDALRQLLQQVRGLYQMTHIHAAIDAALNIQKEKHDQTTRGS